MRAWARRASCMRWSSASRQTRAARPLPGPWLRHTFWPLVGTINDAARIEPDDSPEAAHARLLCLVKATVSVIWRCRSLTHPTDGTTRAVDFAARFQPFAPPAAASVALRMERAIRHLLLTLQSPYQAVRAGR